jgi:hypothetical protein
MGRGEEGSRASILAAAARRTRFMWARPTAWGASTQQTFIDTYSKVVFCQAVHGEDADRTADILDDRVVPFFDDHGLRTVRMLTDRGTDYCGNPEQHPYELYLAVEDIEYTRTKVRSPQTNGYKRMRAKLTMGSACVHTVHGIYSMPLE